MTDLLLADEKKISVRLNVVAIKCQRCDLRLAVSLVAPIGTTSACALADPAQRKWCLGIERDKSLQLPGFLMALEAIDAIDVDLRVVKTGCGKPIDDLPA